MQAFWEGRLADSGLLKQACLVDGKWVNSEATITVDNPSTSEIIAHVPRMTRAEVAAALANAAEAGKVWAATTPAARAAVLERWHDLLMAHQEDLAVIMTAEQGKPLAEARGEIAYSASFMKWFSEEAQRSYGDVIAGAVDGLKILTSHEPVGLSVAITPWNFPAAMITRKAGAALAAGCAMVIKPSELTPLTALAIAELALRAGVPNGVLNVVTGLPSEIGTALSGHPAVCKLSFTGSTLVGRLLAAQCAPTLKRLSLELGGNAPFIVFDDADLDQAVAGLMASKFRNSGQTCVCANRIYVQATIYDSFAKKLAAAVTALKVGDGFAAGSTIGPLINDAAKQKVERHVADAVAKGAKILCAADAPDRPRYVTPMVLTGANAAMQFSCEETFGPIAPLFSFEDEVEVIAAANASESGLAAYVYTEDMRRIQRITGALETGMVGVNTGTVSMASAPFGGVKQSGYGREGSKYGLAEYQAIKTVHLQY